MSDFLSPETPKFLRPEDPTNSTNGGGGTPTPTPSGGAYPVYIVIDPDALETPLVFKQGDVGAELVVLLRHLNGIPMDLTGKTVSIKAWPIAGGDLTIEEAVAIECARFGIVSYIFVGGDTDTAGSYNVEFVVANADGSPGTLTYPANGYLRMKILPNQ